MSTLKYKYDHRMRKRLYSRENGTGYHNTKYNKNTIRIDIRIIHYTRDGQIWYTRGNTVYTAPARGK